MKIVFPLIAVMMLALGGCGGFRSGFASVPYIGDSEPVAEEKFFEFYDHSLLLPGLKLDVSVNNRIKTRDIAVMLFIVPISIDLMDRPFYTETDKLQISLSIIPREEGFTLDLSEALVTVDGKSLRPVKAEHSGGPYYDDKRIAVDTAIPLVKDKYQPYEITFDCPVPTTDRTITLDLGRALTHPQHPAIPLIKFKKVRWKQGYT